MTDNRKLVERFEAAVRANGYRTCDDATESEYQAAKAALSAALSRPIDPKAEVEPVAWLHQNNFEKDRFWIAVPHGKGDTYWSDAFPVYRSASPSVAAAVGG